VILTKQEMFDKVAVHLLTQGKRSTQGTSCAYRGDGGLKCAIGCLIPDERYSRDLEGEAASTWPVREAAGFDISLSEFATALQQMHDDCAPDEWLGQLAAEAEYYHLSPACLAPFEATP